MPLTQPTQIMPQNKLEPCAWAQGELYLNYHDQEWGRPCYERNKLFAKLCLEGQQAGLSWITVLKKRAAYYKFAANLEPEQLAQFSDAQLDNLLKQPELIRHKGKIYSLRTNAQALLNLEKQLNLEAQGITFVDWIWSFVGGVPHINTFASLTQVPSQTEVSQKLSRALKKHGFVFIGPTSCYAFMQSMGLVNDHLTNCPQHPINLNK